MKEAVVSFKNISVVRLCSVSTAYYRYRSLQDVRIKFRQDEAPHLPAHKMCHFNASNLVVPNRPLPLFVPSTRYSEQTAPSAVILTQLPLPPGVNSIENVLAAFKRLALCIPFAIVPPFGEGASSVFMLRKRLTAYYEVPQRNILNKIRNNALKGSKLLTSCRYKYPLMSLLLQRGDTCYEVEVRSCTPFVFGVISLRDYNASHQN